MPALTDKAATILVTGANGFVGAWVVSKLLNRGYSVRAAVRTQSKGRHLLDTNSQYGDKLEIAAVGDIATDGAFDEAVKGVDGIIHTASPVTMAADDPKELIEPAVNGAVGILASALKHGSSVKRIVVTSSFSAVIPFPSPPVTITEALWNDAAVKDCEENGRNAKPMSKYAASKTLAERAVWAFHKEHKSKVTWDVTVINPPFIFGPVVHEVTTPDSLNSSTKLFYDGLVKGESHGQDPSKYPDGGWVDIRDIAEAHIKALEVPAAGGERVLVIKDTFVWQDFYDIANSLSPKPYHTLATGTPGAILVRNRKVNMEKAPRLLGLEYIAAEEMIKDTLADYVRRGW
ncbi:D-lactaldehyde dehydrogenase [Heliocybe sulcata]|uniref:D-lactaldehyde dehydrogenase n=1 Tax=Heliocybe sulcata TaxID=5364 RepID=A0A5C3MZ56_9AGAM|nr:D-lactaldehyde dehydrogenase [Heliocybe sulcata]